jgi:glycosyltransferase involved in cell wall biosynthesis
MRVLVATAMYPKPERPAFGSFVKTQVESLRKAGVDVDVFVLDGPNRKLMYPKAVSELRRRVRIADYDLVHAHYSYVGAVARMQRRVPLLLTFHGDDILGTVDERGRTTPTSRLISAAGRRLGELVEGVIVQTEQMARRFRRSDVHVIPHEVDLETFRPVDRDRARAELGLDPERRYVLFAASPAIPVKNFRLAESAVELLGRLGLECELIVVHQEPQSRLALYMSACDALAFPSWQEGSPNIVKQAMACNMPIVGTDVGDVRALISATLGCHVVPHGEEAFAAGLRQELELRRRTNGRDAVKHLSCELVAGRLIRAYEQTLHGSSRAANVTEPVEAGVR